MGKVLFWNVAGAGTGYEGEEVAPTLAAYTSEATAVGNKIAPECVVVCEMRKVKKAQKAEWGFAKYTYVKPARPQKAGNAGLGYYHSDNDKRLYCYSLNPGTQVAQLTTGASRPSVLLLVDGHYILCMHAPSGGPQTSTPQSAEIMAAYDEAVKLGKTPSAIFGDLNVDAQNDKRRQRLQFHLAGHALQNWRFETSGVLTHKSDSELDWAICDPNFPGKVHALGAEKRRKVVVDEDADWDGAYEAKNKHSDHKPILLSW